jgi:hypothetical protein
MASWVVGIATQLKQNPRDPHGMSCWYDDHVVTSSKRASV